MIFINQQFENFNLDRYFIDGKLSIFGVQAADEGHFTCQATNKLLKKSIHLPIAIGKYCRVYLYIESFRVYWHSPAGQFLIERHPKANKNFKESDSENFSTIQRIISMYI